MLKVAAPDIWKMETAVKIISHGMKLLAAGEKVTVAALECGYNSPSAFISVFKTAFGHTPSHYLGQPIDLRRLWAINRKGLDTLVQHALAYLKQAMRFRVDRRKMIAK